MLFVSNVIESHALSKIEVGLPAPNFTLESTTGAKISLSNFKGKVVLIDFWATWCPPCRYSIPVLIRLHEKFKKEKFVILGINIDESRSHVPTFVKKQKIQYPVLYGSGTRVEWDYRIRSIPSFYLVDTEGKLAKIYLGFHPDLEEEWKEDIRKLLSKNK